MMTGKFGKCPPIAQLALLVIGGLLLWPLTVHYVLAFSAETFGFDRGVGFAFYGVVHNLLAILFGLLCYAITSSSMTLRGLLLAFGLSMSLGMINRFFGVSSETLTNLVMLLMGVLALVILRGSGSVFRYAVFFLSMVLVSIQLIHHASMTFGPYAEDNARIETLVASAVTEVASTNANDRSECLHRMEIIDACSSFPDAYASGYTTLPALLAIMEDLRERWDQTQQPQIGHYRDSKALSSQWAIYFDGERWAVAKKDNRFLIDVYAPVLTWLFVWASFWWTLTFLGLAAWHERATRAELRTHSVRIARGLAWLLSLHVVLYLLLAVFAGHLIPESLVMSDERRDLLASEFSHWFLVMAGTQLSGTVTLSLIVWGFHAWMKRRRSL